MAKAKSKAKKENKIHKLTQLSMEEAQKGMLEMATELRELRGLPKVIQKQFEEQQEISEVKELLASNKKATRHLTTTDSSQGWILHSGL